MTLPFFQGLKETGYIEGQNVAVEYQFAENEAAWLPALAADLVRQRQDLFAGGRVRSPVGRGASCRSSFTRRA
jgi:hypothetical protein